MRCNRVDDLLPAYLDGDLASRVNRQVSAHLDACERCRQAQAEQQRALRFLEGARYVPSIDLWADFSRRLEQENRSRQSPWQLLWQPGLAGALAAAVVSVVALTASDRRSSVRWMPAPPGSVQMARVPEAGRLEVAPAEPGPVTRVARLVPARPAAPSAIRFDFASSPVRSTRAEAGVRQVPRRARRQTRHVVMARNDVSTEARRSPREAGVDRDPQRRPWRVAALTSAPEPIGGLRSEAPGGTDVTEIGPLDAAEALMTVQQDAASDQMRNELLLMARGVARVSGELPSDPISGDGAGT